MNLQRTFRLILLLLPLWVLTVKSNASITTVTVNASSFSPSSFNINVGDTVKWVWGAGGHTTTSTTIPGGATAWDHVIAAATDSFMYHVTTPGAYAYKCTPHGFTGSFTAAYPALPGTFLVTVNGSSFSPANVDCAIGDTIVWVLGATATHTTTSTTLPAGAASWDSPISATTPSFSYITTVAGVHNYKCTPHGFTGTITVAGSTSTTDASANAQAFSVFPQPSGHEVTISLSLIEASEVSVSLFDVSGKQISSQTKFNLSSGSQNLNYVIDPSVTGGNYFLQVSTSRNISVQQIIVY